VVGETRLGLTSWLRTLLSAPLRSTFAGVSLQTVREWIDEGLAATGKHQEIFFRSFRR
jgi:hypothetical protein